MLLALGYMISYLFGVGLLLLPELVQQIGIGYFLIGMTGVAITLNLAAYVILELIEITGEDVENSVKAFLGKAGNLIPALLGVFTYSALTAYVVAAGDQLSAWLGGDPRYWSALFFILAAIPVVKGLTAAANLSMYLSFFLISVLLFIIPINLKYDYIVPPIYGNVSAIPLFLTLAVFALAGHLAVREVYNFVRDEKKSLQIFFWSFAFAFLTYLAFGITTSAVAPNISGLSTATLVKIYPPFYSLLISVVAVLAFYTSFVAISHSFIKSFEKYTSKKSIYSLLLFPIAILYMMIRDFNLFSLTTLVGRVGGVSFLIFLSLACFAHFKASKKWKVKLSPYLTLPLSVIFGLTALIGLFV